MNAAEWNAKYPVGTRVRFWRVGELGSPYTVETNTVAPAYDSLCDGPSVLLCDVTVPIRIGQLTILKPDPTAPAMNHLETATLAYYDAYRELMKLTGHHPTDPTALALASLSVHSATMSTGKACDVFGIRHGDLLREILSADAALKILAERCADELKAKKTT